MHGSFILFVIINIIRSYCNPSRGEVVRLGRSCPDPHGVMPCYPDSTSIPLILHARAIDIFNGFKPSYTVLPRTLTYN